MVTPRAQYQPETLPPAAAKSIDQGQDGASMGREEPHQLVQADCRRAMRLLQGRPIELVLDVPGVQTYPRDSVLALRGMSTSSSTHTLSGAQHLRRGQVVAAATAPFLAFGDLQPGDAAQMHFVRAVSDAQAAGADPQIGQRGIRG